MKEMALACIALWVRMSFLHTSTHAINCVANIVLHAGKPRGTAYCAYRHLENCLHRYKALKAVLLLGTVNQSRVHIKDRAAAVHVGTLMSYGRLLSCTIM
jgi:hypothetical protein